MIFSSISKAKQNLVRHQTYLMACSDQSATFTVVEKDGSRDGWDDQGTVLQIFDVDGSQWNVVYEVHSAVGQVGQCNILGSTRFI